MAGLAKRAKSPTSAQTPAAVSVSTPRKQRSLEITGAWLEEGICSSSAAKSEERLPIKTSTEVR